MRKAYTQHHSCWCWYVRTIGRFSLYLLCLINVLSVYKFTVHCEQCAHTTWNERRRRKPKHGSISSCGFVICVHFIISLNSCSYFNTYNWYAIRIYLRCRHINCCNYFFHSIYYYCVALKFDLTLFPDKYYFDIAKYLKCMKTKTKHFFWFFHLWCRWSISLRSRKCAQSLSIR